MTRYFCTYFDQNYLVRGLALYRSLERHCPSFELWILCLDSVCYQLLSRLKLTGVHLIHLEELERVDKLLYATKGTRTQIEYYFTCSPCFPAFVLSRYPSVDQIAYLDADLFFFRDPSVVFSEIETASIAIVPHRFHPALQERTQFGVYNVGWVSFRRNEQGLACLSFWREQCLEWCFARCEGDRFADQKYLDQWPNRFSNVWVIQQKGANLAPWNVANYRIWKSEAGVLVDEHPLVFYHFHHLTRMNEWVYDPGLYEYKTTLTSNIRRHIYVPYIRALQDAEQELRSAMRGEAIFRNARGQYFLQSTEVRLEGAHLKLVQSIRRTLDIWRGVVFGEYVFLRPTPDANR